MMIKYCCDPFFHALDNAGKKGFSIIASKENDDVFYYIQSRLCNFKDKDEFVAKFKSLPKPLGISIPMEMQKKIEYCPFCGKRLDTMLQTFNPETMEILDEHKKYLSY